MVPWWVGAMVGSLQVGCYGNYICSGVVDSLGRIVVNVLFSISQLGMLSSTSTPVLYSGGKVVDDLRRIGWYLGSVMGRAKSRQFC